MKNSGSFVLTLLTIKLEVPEEDGAEEALGLGTLSGSSEDVPGVLATGGGLLDSLLILSLNCVTTLRSAPSGNINLSSASSNPTGDQNMITFNLQFLYH